MDREAVGRKVLTGAAFANMAAAGMPGANALLGRRDRDEPIARYREEPQQLRGLVTATATELRQLPNFATPMFGLTTNSVKKRAPTQQLVESADGCCATHLAVWVWRLSARVAPAARNRTTKQRARMALKEGTMANAVLKSPADVVEFLIGQHERINSLFAETLSSSGEAREKCFVELRRLLAVHETAEEEVVHPRTKREIANGDIVIQMRLQEENHAKTVLAEMEKLDVDDERFTRQLTRLRYAVLDHARHEEQEEFVTLQQGLSSDELDRMGRAAKLAEAIAPTRPHTRTESRSENLLAGPFLAMIDRARDAIHGKG